MKNIFLLIIIIFFFMSCSKTNKDNNENKDVIEINGKIYNFNIPVISRDTTEIKEYLKKTDSNIKNWKKDEKYYLDANIKTNENDLFKSAYYSFYIKNENISYICINLSYNDIIPNESTKKFVRNYLVENCK